MSSSHPGRTALSGTVPLRMGRPRGTRQREHSRTPTLASPTRPAPGRPAAGMVGNRWARRLCALIPREQRSLPLCSTIVYHGIVQNHREINANQGAVLGTEEAGSPAELWGWGGGTLPAPARVCSPLWQPPHWEKPKEPEPARVTTFEMQINQHPRPGEPTATPATRQLFRPPPLQQPLLSGESTWRYTDMIDNAILLPWVPLQAALFVSVCTESLFSQPALTLCLN